VNGPHGFGRRSLLLLLLLIAYGLYAAAYIRATSFVIDGTRYFSLFDDAMVSMRYARNLADGFGLVWNPNSPAVEGYTNPLWVLYMSVFHAAGLPDATASLPIQLAGAVSIALMMVLAWRLTERLTAGSLAAAAMAALLVGFFLPLNLWSLQGMEVGALALLVTYAAWRACDDMERRRFSPGLWIVLGVATLLRMDAVVPYACFLLVLAFTDSSNRRRHLLLGGSILIGSLLLQTAFRVWYYGSPLPNTYYLKMSGYPVALRVSRGLLALCATIWRMNVLIWIAALTLYVFRRDRRVLVLSALVVSAASYSVYVGGDAWEGWGGANRYLCAVMPLFFVLVATALHDWYRRIVGSPPDTPPHQIAFGVVALCVLVNLNMFAGPASLGEAALVRSPFVVDINQRMVRVGLLLRELTDPQARVAVTWAGALPYFADRESIDILGKNDPIIAHQPMRLTARGLARLVAFHPGHLKWDYAYSIGALQPDVITDLWINPEDALGYLRSGYVSWKSGDLGFWLKRGSRHVNWEAAARRGTIEDVP
jgi:hypothetical protein